MAKAIAEVGDWIKEPGWPVMRVTMTSPSLPYRLRAARAALACARKSSHCRNVSKLVLAGHSNGARVAATLATELLQEREKQEGDSKLGKPVGCVLFSYPLHAPGNISGMRDAELLALRVPMLIIRGEVPLEHPSRH